MCNLKKIIKIKDIDSMYFAGPNDKNIKLIEKNFKSNIVLRGNELLIDGTKHVESQMYENSRDTIKGVSRSIFPALNYHISIFIIAVTILILIGIAPIYIILSDFLTLTNQPINRITFSYITFINMIISWAIMCAKFNHNILTALIHPIIIILIIITGVHSLLTSLSGSIKWKDRKIPKRNIRI